MSIRARRIASGALRVSSPGWGSCMCCGMPWRVVDGHTTTYQRDFPPRRGRRTMRYGSSRGMFPLCEQCWQELGTTDARLPYYEALVLKWEMHGADRGELTSEYLREILDLEDPRVTAHSGPAYPVRVTDVSDSEEQP